MLSFVKVGVITVANGESDSDALISNHTISDAEDLTIVSPGTMPETASIQLSLDFDVDYQLNGSTLAAAAGAATWDDAPAGAALGAAGALANFKAGLLTSAAWRIHLSIAAGADRVFTVYKRVYGAVS